MGVDLFSIGRSSLGASKKALSTTSHNIANANDENYSRQRLTTQANTPIGEGSYVLGTGVKINSVKRINDDLLNKKLNNSLSQESYDSHKYETLSEIEMIFNEVNSEGMNKILNRFFNSFRELANQPESPVMRTLVRDNARLVVDDFKRINASINEVTDRIDRKVEKSIDSINLISSKIVELNKEIVRLENVGGETGDLRDQRDAQVRELSEFFQLNTYEDDKGQYVVNVKGVGTLVTGGQSTKIKSGSMMNESTDPRPKRGRVDIFFENRPNQPLGQQLKRGKLKALIETRNNHLDSLIKKVDSIAYALVTKTNEIHQQGYPNLANPPTQNTSISSGQATSDNQIDQGAGISFFKNIISENGASEEIALSNEIEADINNIVAGLEPNSPGDNRIAIAISKLGHEKIIGDNDQTLEETYLSAVGEIGLATAKTNIDHEQSRGILAQTKSMKQRLSGVSLDEEAANLVKYQHNYDASAKVIKTADEMFDSVLGMMR